VLLVNGLAYRYAVREGKKKLVHKEPAHLKSCDVAYFAGPFAPVGLGVTIALKRNVVALGHVLAVTVIVLF